ncbi:helix-turn-helix transcriptional regulator [Haladaptatus salinisoli]|uniref:helix-turn-helix transcriptional regulator n=1 Tax=Haladaptatus salinisoli TaxID=2884876 RepID=UPI001D0B9F9E|nr:transcriptional regulator FilR1 domain-containing protein [Haladaptatus salinisoli]
MVGESESLVRYVLRSRTRTTVLIGISNGQRSVKALLEHESASKSAVYNALSNLENHGLVYNSQSKQWYLTGSGSLVVNFLHRQQRLEKLIETDQTYWQSHDVTALPHSFQFDLSELVPGSIIRATDTQPSRAVREVEDRFEATTSADVVAPIYDQRQWSALLDRCESCRLIIAEAVLSALRNDGGPISGSIEDLDIRVADVSFELAVTDDCLLLSLPLLDGSYDVQTVFIAKTERARTWGTKLFERIWADAVRIDDSPESLGTNSELRSS